MKQKYILAFILVVVITLTLLSFNDQGSKEEVITPKSVDGYLDLSNWSFKEDGVVPLNGKWEFYFNEFIDHQQFLEGNHSKATYVEIPSTIKSMNETKPFEENKFYGTLRIVIKLPEQAYVYGLRSDIILSSYKLFVDGEFFGEVGRVGTNKIENKPYYKVLNSYFDPLTNEVELLYHTSDFHYEDCAIVPPVIGLANQIASESRFNLGRDLFLFGMLLIMGIYHLGLYIMRTKDRAPLYFGVFCLMFGIRMLVVGERFLPGTILLDSLFYPRLSYFTVYIGSTALLGFLYFTFTDLFPKWFLKISFIMGLVSAGLTLLLPFYLLDLWILVYVIVGFSLLGYALIKLINGVLKEIPYTTGVLVGFVCLVAAFINDYIYEITLANHASTIPLGMAIFILTQAYTLSAKFSGAFSKAENLSIENELMLLEVKHVNGNLESIVDERTSELKKTLVEMDLMSKTDYLTKLPNRRFMVQKIEKIIDEKKPFSVAVADIDKFKNINDTFGHDSGDAILIELSNTLQDALGDDGFVGRWGGEEFLLVFFTNQESVLLEKANEIRELFANQTIESINSTVTFTIGLCPFSDDISLDLCIANADKALYEGKLNGRNQCRIYKS